jgi:hypothetical protein
MKYSLVTLLVYTTAVLGQERQVLSLQNRIDLPNISGRIDHFAADLKGNRLFVAALANHTVEVLDAESGKRLKTIGDLAEPQGLYFDSATNRLFVASAKDGTAKVFDGASFQLLETTQLGSDADNIRYDTRGRRVVVGHGVGTGALAFLGPDGKKTGEIGLAGHPESFQIERSGTRAFVNVPDHKEVQVADLVANSVVAKWPLAAASKNYPMTLDEARHRLFIGCREPARMLVIDTETGKPVSTVDIVGDTDDIFHDSMRNRVYVIGGAGYLDVFEPKDDTHYQRVAHLPTSAGARTGLFVQDWGKLFVAVPKRGGDRAGILVFETR